MSHCPYHYMLIFVVSGVILKGPVSGLILHSYSFVVVPCGRPMGESMWIVFFFIILFVLFLTDIFDDE